MLARLLLLAVLVQAGEKKLVIVALGDSTTAGTPYFKSPLEAPPKGKGDRQGQYSYWMNRMDAGWRVLNRGVNRQRSDEILARFERDVVKEKPKYVIILAGINDVWQGYPAAKTKANLSEMYDHAAKAGIVPIAASVLPVDLANEKQDKEIASLNDWIKNEAGRRKIPFCDLHSVAASPNDPTRLALSAHDGLHPDLMVYQHMGEALARLIVELERPKK